MKKATVELNGEQRTLTLDFNALAEIEEALGRNMLESDAWQGLSAKDIRYVLFVALKRDYPEVTLDEAGELSMTALSELTRSAGMGAEEETPDPLAGASSGPSDATTSD